MASTTSTSPTLADVDDALEHSLLLHYRSQGADGTVAAHGAPEWLIIAIVVLVLFGGSQLPKLARSLGQAQKEFKKGLNETATGRRPRATRPAKPDES